MSLDFGFDYTAELRYGVGNGSLEERRAEKMMEVKTTKKVKIIMTVCKGSTHRRETAC